LPENFDIFCQLLSLNRRARNFHLLLCRHEWPGSCEKESVVSENLLEGSISHLLAHVRGYIRMDPYINLGVHTDERERILTGTAFVGDLDVLSQPGTRVALEGLRVGVKLALPLFLTDPDHHLQQWVLTRHWEDPLTLRWEAISFLSYRVSNRTLINHCFLNVINYKNLYLTYFLFN